MTEEWKEVVEVKGKTITDVEGLSSYSGEVKFIFDDGSSLRMYHPQECCEDVSLTDFDDLTPSDLIGGVLTLFETYTKSSEGGYGIEQYTFYRLRTTKTDVTMRWHGSSNGYYGVEVYLRLEDANGEELYTDF